MKSIRETIKHYEEFLEELCRWELPVFETPNVVETRVEKGPERPNQLTLITNYPKPPINEIIYSRTVCLDNLPFNENLDVVLSQLKRFGSYTIRFNERRLAFVTFKDMDSVQSLVEGSEGNDQDGFQLRVRVACRDITVPFRPWKLRDSTCNFKSSTRVEDRRSVFISGVPLSYSAVDLGSFVSREFGGVSYTSLNTDEFQYPKGTAIVVFHDTRSQITALTASRIKLPDTKIYLTITPFFREDQKCDLCHDEHYGITNSNAEVFCADSSCFKYFCLHCWMLVSEHTRHEDNHPSFFKKGVQMPQSLPHAKQGLHTVDDLEQKYFHDDESPTNLERTYFQRSNSLTTFQRKSYQKSQSITDFGSKPFQRSNSLSSYERKLSRKSVRSYPQRSRLVIEHNERGGSRIATRYENNAPKSFQYNTKNKIHFGSNFEQKSDESNSFNDEESQSESNYFDQGSRSSSTYSDEGFLSASNYSDHGSIWSSNYSSHESEHNSGVEKW